MQFKKRKPRRSDFAGALATLDSVVQAWCNQNAPTAKVSKGRIERLTQYDIEITFRLDLPGGYGVVSLKGGQDHFSSSDISDYYKNQLIEKLQLQLSRVVTQHHYSEHYQLFREYTFRTGRDEFVLDQTPGWCRFCERGWREAPFRKRRHAVSEMFGNRSLLTKAECDDCNKYFGNTIEKDLADFTEVARHFSYVPGKHGSIPCVTDEGGKIIAQVIDDVTHITMDSGEEVFQQIEEEKSLSRTFPGKVLTPVGALKALTKFAISIMPDSEFAYFKEVAKWVRDPEHENGIPGRCPIIHTSFFKESHRTGGAMLLRRRSDDLSYPYLSFTLCFGNHYFQSFLPAPAELQHDQVEAFPHCFVAKAQPVSYKTVDLGGTKPTLMSPSTVSLKVEGEITRGRQEPPKTQLDI